jgi:hypothetical protein
MLAHYGIPCGFKRVVTDKIEQIKFSLRKTSRYVGRITDIIYSGASVHELNPFLEAVREPKFS